MSKKKKILLIAPYADPEDVGEAWSAYQWVRGITDHFSNVTILGLHKRNRSIEKHFLDHKVISWPEISIFSKFERFNAMLKPSYPFFYARARKWIRSELKKGMSWDLIHQVSPLALRYPCPAHDFGIPYIIGPLAGSVAVNNSFKKEMNKAQWYTRLTYLDRIRINFDIVLRNSYQNSTLLLGVAPYVKDILKGISLRQFAVMNETGIYKVHEKNCCCDKKGNRKFNLLYVGRIVRSKGVRDLVRALGSMKRNNMIEITLDILGDGDDRIFCEKEAKQLHVDDLVKFHGRVDRSVVYQFYKKADLFVFPSFKEPSGNVVLEAMSHGLPMIVCSQGGPGYTVKDSFGIKIEPESPQMYQKKLASAIHELVESPNRLVEMRKAALDEARKYYFWPNKIDKIIKHYKSILFENNV